jgi:hypothetical protein
MTRSVEVEMWVVVVAEGSIVSAVLLGARGHGCGRGR